MRRPNRFTLIVAALAWALVVVASAGAGARAEDNGPPAPDAPRLRLRTIDPHAVSFAVGGEDPGAPRRLVLWRWDGRSFLRIGETHSEPSGRFDFGERPVSFGESYLDVSPLGRSPSTRRMERVARADPAPRVTFASGLGGLAIQVHVARREGELRIYDGDDDRLLLRVPIDPGTRGSLDLDLDRELGNRRPRTLWFRQVLADGHASPPSFWRLDQSDPSR